VAKKRSAGKKTMAPKAAPAKNATRGWVFWTPRILSIVFILFISVFSLDVFGEGNGFWGTLLAFLVHNIPSFVLLAVLLIAWKHELAGTVAFGLFGILYIIMTVIRSNTGERTITFGWVVIYSLIIAGPAFLVAWLFYKGWREKRRIMNR
jgi:hypothetical protein